MPFDNVQFDPFAQKMQAADLPPLFIETFYHYYNQLVAGQTGLIPEADIEPVTAVPDAEQLPGEMTAAGEAALGETAVIKLNGGLGTSMGLQQAKSLLPVKNGLSFLDIIARQALQTGVPLILMNSFVTEADSLAALANYPDLQKAVPLSFVQHKEPKVSRETMQPVAWPDNPELEWCPPGHGDIYTALVTSGTLDALLENGYRYAFVSNADNLGAVMDTAILGYFVHNDFPFMMEVADRTEMDKKGGHLARRPDGQLILRESAQCPEADVAKFQDVGRHKYFNTNNLWLNLEALRSVLAANDNRLPLPMIRNQKTVDPRDPESTAVYQLETAMGSAIGVFPGAQALRVPRNRFAPVKTTDDLFLVRSNAYTLTDDFRVLPDPARVLPLPVVELDRDFYKFVPDLEHRFPAGPPALDQCTAFSVAGDIAFGQDVVCVQEVHLQNKNEQPLTIPDGQVLSGTQVWR